MSEIINNREYRQKVLKELIRELHDGKSVEEIKPRFEELIKGISPAEISEMEQALIMEGMPVEEIQRLCDAKLSTFSAVSTLTFRTTCITMTYIRISTSI